MANEIQIAAKPGKDLYALVLNEIGQVKNIDTNEYEDLDPANWNLYAIPAIEVPGTGIFFADMPDSPPGVFGILAYEMKTGIEAAPSDAPPIAPPGEMQWDGTKEIPLYDILSEIANSGIVDPFLKARLYGPADPLDSEGRQVFRDVETNAPRVRLSPTLPRGGRIVELDPVVP